jgi:hypothetical protein
MAIIIRISVLVWLAALYGCSNQPIKLSTASAAQRLLASDAVRVAIDPKEYARTDDLQQMGRIHPNAIETGPFWQRAFIGNAASVCSFTIDSTQLRGTVEGMGFVGRMTYVIDGTLKCVDQSTPIHAEGSRAAAMNMIGAMRESVELGIASATHQIAAVMSATKQ